ncbi:MULTISPECIES: PE domain-containing protein [unclassified Pseudonocardia]|uniref:PE domain-containing protein n=1 Tax=unclassified Pseudonocardia TaxID=2619320 RepID=UPI000A5BB85D|nr:MULTISPECIES: PE domain-containing protein [unclassified Pseudonocardia]
MDNNPLLPRGTESDALMVQISRSNVLAVRNELRFQAEQMQAALMRAGHDCRVRPCGQDVVSLDAALSFRRKIQQIIAVHTAHLHEITEAVDRLTEAAHHYGYTEEAITASLDAARPLLTARLQEYRS